MVVGTRQPTPGPVDGNGAVTHARGMTPQDAVEVVNRIEFRGLLRDIGFRLSAYLTGRGDVQVDRKSVV